MFNRRTANTTPLDSRANSIHIYSHNWWIYAQIVSDSICFNNLTFTKTVVFDKAILQFMSFQSLLETAVIPITHSAVSWFYTCVKEINSFPGRILILRFERQFILLINLEYIFVFFLVFGTFWPCPHWSGSLNP